MQFEALGNPLILIPTGIIVILDFLALPLFIKWLKNGERKRLRYLLFFKPFSTLICIYFMFTPSLDQPFLWEHGIFLSLF